MCCCFHKWRILRALLRFFFPLMADRLDLEDAVDQLNASVAALQADIATLKAAPAPTTDGSAPAVDLSPLEARVSALEVAVLPPKVEAPAETPAA